MKIIAKEWRSAVFTIGFVAYETGFEGQWNAVVGYVPRLVEVVPGLNIPVGGINEEADAQYIAGNGAKLSYKEAAVFFPQFDITKYKYYPESLKEKKKTGFVNGDKGELPKQEYGES